jgi:hypothetical protein
VFYGVLCSTWSRFCSGLILALARTLTQMSMAIILGLQLDVQSDEFLTLISYEVYVCFSFFSLPFPACVLSVCYVARHYWASWDGVLFPLPLFVSSQGPLIPV